MRSALVSRLCLASMAVRTLMACSGSDTGAPGHGDDDTGLIGDDGTSDGADGESDGPIGGDGGTDAPPDDAGDAEDGTGVPRLPAGEPCEQNDECATGICLIVDTAASVGFCSSYCLADSDCPDESWSCVFLRNSGADAALVCVPDDLCIDRDLDGFGIGDGCDGPDCDDDDPAVFPAADEICDGLDNDCDDIIDENPLGTREDCETGFQGLCAAGEQYCENGFFVCNPLQEPHPEICDGLDNDCDGSLDENEAGDPIAFACYGGPPETIGVGACREGARSCIAGSLTDCAGAVLPFIEVCDGLDNDCDGAADEESPGAGYVCDTGLPGACGPGLSACSPEGELLCEQRFFSRLESCDGLDDDCDGLTDEDAEGNPMARSCYEGPDGTAGVGVCTAGVESCAGGEFTACVGDVTPSTEICDGLDNDCDGEADEENPGGNVVCSTGALGLCASGVTECQDAAIVCVPNVTASDEVCDGLDNDCDGAADEDPSGSVLARDCYDGAEGTEGVGVCRGGVQTCMFGDWSPCVGQIIPTVESCDESDNDCDTETDEGVTRTYWRDQDDDNYGDPASPIEACFRPVGYATNSSDCYDLNGDANPSQRGFFGPNRGDGSWDYNCNGASEQQTLSQGACEAAWGLCQLTVGWEGSTIPSCGQSANYLFECRGVLLFCAATTEVAQQACR